MATKYLDNTGLAYFWGKIKSYVASLLGSKADDSAVVHISGTETITGTKTLSSVNTITYSDTAAESTKNILYGRIASNDYFRLLAGGANNAGYLEIATADDGNEPIYIRQYKGVFTTLQRTATLLDSSGNTVFPGTVTASGFIGNVTGDCSGSSGSCTGNAASASAVAWSGVTGKPTTIAGYGITDAKIANGTITLGSNSITPLTSHQTLPTLSRTISGSGNAITDITVSNHAITATKGATFLTSHQTLPTLSLTTSGSGNAITALSVNNHAITATKGSTFLTSHQDISGKVNKSGDTMTGNLTVPSVIVSGSFIKQHPNITKGTNPSSTQYWTLTFADKNGANYSNNCLGMLETSITSAGVVSTYIRAMKNTAANSSNCQISCVYDTANNTAYTAAPTPAAADNSTKIATTAWCRAATGDFACRAASAKTLSIPASDLTKGTKPTSTYWNTSWIRSDSAGTAYANRLCELRSFVDTNGKSGYEMLAYDFKSGSGAVAVLGIYKEMDGAAYGTAPTPSATNDDSTKIATTAWCRDATGNFACNAATASSAAKLTTARKINGVSFDGSADVTLTAVVSSASRSADIAANGTFTVPSYIVGAQALLVYLDGCLSRQGDGWAEVGTAGAASTTIKFLQLIPKAMEIVVRVN